MSAHVAYNVLWRGLEGWHFAKRDDGKPAEFSLRGARAAGIGIKRGNILADVKIVRVVEDVK